MYKARSEMEATERRQAQMAARSRASMQQIAHGTKVIMGGAALAAGGILAYSTVKAANFEAQIDSLGAVSNATAKELKALEDQALKAGAATKFSALEAAQAQTELAKGGLDVATILGGALDGALALAAAGEMDLAAAAATTVNALKAFSLGGKDAGHVADALATAANTTTADVSDFAMALTQGSAAAKAAGLSFDDTMVALEALAEMGVKGSDAGTSLKAALTQLASPTDKAAELSKELGLAFFDANGEMKSMPAVAGMLRDKLGDLTKEQRLQAATTLVGTDGMRALLALYDAGPQKLEKLERGLAKQGTAAQVAAEKQDNLRGKAENFMGSIETAAIKIGQRVLPMLTELAEDATDFVNHLAETGQLDAFADNAAKGLSTLVDVGGDVVEVGADVAGVLLDIADAANLGDPTNIKVIVAAIVGFKAASTVTPMVLHLSSAVSDLVLNARTAPTALAFFKSLPVGPVGLAATAVAGLAAGLVLLNDSESDEARAARESAEAHNAQAEAIRDVMRAEQEAADAGLAAQRADLRVKEARDATAAAREELAKARALPSDSAGRAEAIAAAHDRVKESLLGEREAVFDARGAHALYDEEVGKQAGANAVRVGNAFAELIKARARLKDFENGDGSIANFDAHSRQMEIIADRTQDYVRALARAAVSEQSRKRLMNEASQITDKNAVGISRLIGVMDRVPKNFKTKLIFEDQQALARAGSYADQVKAIAGQRITTRIVAQTESAKGLVMAFRAVVAGVPARAVLNIVANAKNKKDEVEQLKDAMKTVKAPPPVDIRANANERRREIQQLQSQVDNLRGKEITITTRRVTILETRKVGARAAGRGSGAAEDSLVGEGRGPEWVIDSATGRGALVTGPTLMRLEPQDYVIPTEQRYRGRALGLLADVAASLGVGAYAGGRKAKVGGVKVTKPKSVKQALGLPIPAQISEGGVPFDSVSSDRSRIRGDYQQARKDHATAKARYSKTFDDLEAAKNDKIGSRELESGPYKGQPANHALRRSLTKKLAELKKDRDRAQAREKRLRPMAEYVDRLYKAARKTDGQAKGLQSEINLQSDYMADADRRGDQTGYTSARTARRTATRSLITLLQRALSLAKPNSAYARQLREELARLGGQAAVTGTAPSGANDGDFGGDLGDAMLSGSESDMISESERDASQQAEDEAEKTKEIAAGRRLSDADQERLDALERDMSLAEVDTPDDKTDDLRVAEGLRTFWEGVLANLRSSTTATPASVKAAADAVTAARRQVKDIAETAVASGSTGPSDAIAAAAAEQMAKLDSERVALYRDFGSNFIDRSRGGVRDINMHFEEPPPDPHTWSKGLEWELRQAV